MFIELLTLWLDILMCLRTLDTPDTHCQALLPHLSLSSPSHFYNLRSRVPSFWYFTFLVLYPIFLYYLYTIDNNTSICPSYLFEMMELLFYLHYSILLYTISSLSTLQCWSLAYVGFHILAIIISVAKNTGLYMFFWVNILMNFGRYQTVGFIELFGSFMHTFMKSFPILFPIRIEQDSILTSSKWKICPPHHHQHKLFLDF